MKKKMITAVSQKGARGFALPAVVGALVVIGILVLTGYFIASQEMRAGRASANAQIAFYLAERGTNEVINDWTAATMLALPEWSGTTLTGSEPEGAWSVDVMRLATRLFYLDATGTVTEGGTELSGATHRTGLIVRLFSAALDPPAALTTRGGVAMKGAASVHGEDTNPPGWLGLCLSPLGDKPGIMADDTTQIDYSPGDITGTPTLVEDTTINDSIFTSFGELDWAQLVALANLDVTPLGSNISGTEPDTTATGVCTKTTLNNWGNPVEPAAACGDYFPIIYHAGPSVRIQSGGVGQGILLVDGDLDLRGNFVFNGVVIVQGEFQTQGSGNRILGGVMASNADLEEQSLVGGSEVQYSSCAIERAILNNDALTRARPLETRSFMDLSTVMNE